MTNDFIPGASEISVKWGVTSSIQLLLTVTLSIVNTFQSLFRGPLYSDLRPKSRIKLSLITIKLTGI